MLLKIVLAILSNIILFFFAFITSFISFLTGSPIFSPPVVIGLWISLILVVNLWIFGAFRRKSNWFVLSVFSGTFALIVGGYFIYQQYQSSLEMTDSREVDLSEYEPFKWNTKAVSLKEESTLKLEGELPRMDGATALYPLYSAFARAVYPKDEYSFYDSEIASTKTDEAYTRLFNGEVDVIFVAQPSDRQVDRAEALGLELDLTPVGREAFVFFVNKRNPVKGLTVEEIQKIYGGDITNWSELGGNDEEILAFQRPDDSGSQTALEKLMYGKKIMTPPSEQVIGGMGEVIAETANYKNHRNAIGYSYRYFATEMVQNGDIHLLEIEEVYPDKDTIRSDEYPLSAEFYAITAGTDNPNVEKLIEWVTSDQGQWLVEETGYVPLNDQES